jgi:hypothetical protein
MFAWQTALVSTLAQASGHCNLAAITQDSLKSMPKVRPHATTQAERPTIVSHRIRFTRERPTDFIHATIHPEKVPTVATHSPHARRHRRLVSRSHCTLMLRLRTPE